MTNLKAAYLLGVGCLAASAASAQEDFLRRAEMLRPRPGEYKWQQVPWVLDLEEGARRAREEKRPLLIWASGDDPLERC
jgi:hypothetical protein